MTNEKFQAIVAQYEKLVFTICYQMVKDYHEAQNLAQETFISAYIHIDSCKAENYKPWLARIATNKAKDYLKSAYIRRVQLTDESIESCMTDTEPSPDDIYMAKEGESIIYDKINSLNEPYLKVSVMYFIQQKSIDEISRLLDRPLKTVQTQIYRARGVLKNMLREENKNV
ncbi:MAG TPA: RNA polymerase subunit sigma-70 [Ruminococcaceae bacterium]|nr:RNA polymerase subunit sigma-70 [Oscillospiraceae bacterium]